jgi:hypothetical protein
VCIDAAGHGHRQVAHSLKYIASLIISHHVAD